MEVRIRRASKHHQRSRVAHDRWQAGGFGVERPDDHPVRTDRDGRAGPIKRIGVAVLQSPIEHVDQSGLGIRRFGLPCHDVQHPPHPHGTRAHICLSDDVFVARDTYPLVRTWTQHGHLALSIHFRNGGLARDAFRPRQERSSNLGFQYFIGDIGHSSPPDRSVASLRLSCRERRVRIRQWTVPVASTCLAAPTGRGLACGPSAARPSLTAGQTAIRPPSTGRTAPCTKLAASLAR